MRNKRCSGKKKNTLWKIIIFLIIFVICIFVLIGVLTILKNGNINEEESEDESATCETEERQEMSIEQRANADYEEWLAAGMVTALSMQYPDFKIDGIYLTGRTELSKKENSNGVYVIFTAEGTQAAVYSVPLSEERTESGTIDLYTRDLGFATFDMKDLNAINKESYQQIEMNELDELISQSLLVSLYEH